MKTAQETFWQADFGDAYTERNDHPLGPRIHLLSKVLARLPAIGSAFEIGCNRGHNLDALRILAPDVQTSGIEINDYAAGIARASGHDVSVGSVLDAIPAPQVDLVMSRGVLIHINPERLPAVYDFLATKGRYILIDEYFSPSPVAVPYRGNEDRLFKRDFAGEMMDRHALRLIDYGFTWKRDPLFPLDNMNWFLFERD